MSTAEGDWAADPARCRYVIAILLIDGSIHANGPDGQVWVMVGATGMLDRSAQDGTRETAIAISEAHVAAQAEPERWEIIVQNR